MAGIRIPQKIWKDFLERFSQRHAGWLVQVETHDRDTEETVASRVTALHSIELDLEEEKNPRINVTLLSDNKEIKHILFRPSQMMLYMSDQEEEDALQITSLNTENTIRFRGAKVLNVPGVRDEAA
ncbi:MAG TPA: DUF5335 family protein [Terriglobia bacterium]|nr:DUF5335 family protein [Terriglobia bacterium]